MSLPEDFPLSNFSGVFVVEEREKTENPFDCLDHFPFSVDGLKEKLTVSFSRVSSSKRREGLIFVILFIFNNILHFPIPSTFIEFTTKRQKRQFCKDATPFHHHVFWPRGLLITIFALLVSFSRKNKTREKRNVGVQWNEGELKCAVMLFLFALGQRTC